MTLAQMSIVKRWLVLHRDDHAVEYFCWDALLTTWVLGWMGLPSALMLGPLLVPVCLAALLAPDLYVRLRRHLHQAGRLRCDWLRLLPMARR